MYKLSKFPPVFSNKSRVLDCHSSLITKYCCTNIYMCGKSINKLISCPSYIITRYVLFVVVQSVFGLKCGRIG